MTVNRLQKTFQNYLPLPLAESRIYKRCKASLVEVEEKSIKKFGDIKNYVYLCRVIIEISIDCSVTYHKTILQFFFQILGILKINFYICKRNCVALMGTLGCERQMKVFRENGKARGWVYPISATL